MAENAYENGICVMEAILSLLQCVNTCWLKFFFEYGWIMHPTIDYEFKCVSVASVWFEWFYQGDLSIQKLDVRLQYARFIVMETFMSNVICWGQPRATWRVSYHGYLGRWWTSWTQQGIVYKVYSTNNYVMRCIMIVFEIVNFGTAL